MQIIQFPRLLHTIITESVEAHNTDLGFIERTAVIGNTVHQCIKLLFCTVPVERFGEFNQNCVTAALENIIKYSVVLPFCVLRDVKRQFLYAFGQLFFSANSSSCDRISLAVSAEAVTNLFTFRYKNLCQKST